MLDTAAQCMRHSHQGGRAVPVGPFVATEHVGVLFLESFFFNKLKKKKNRPPQDVISAVSDFR